MQIGSENTSVADAASKYGYYFGVAGHLGGEEEGGDEDEERSVEVEEVWDKVEIVFEDNLFEGSVIAQKVIQFFRHIERNDYDNDQNQPKEEVFKIFAKNIAVYDGVFNQDSVVFCRSWFEEQSKRGSFEEEPLSYVSTWVVVISLFP